MAGAIEIAEKEIANIVNKRFTTIFEKRMQALRDEIEATKNEFALQGMGRSGPLVKKILELRRKAVRDIVSARFTIPEKRLTFVSLRLTEESKVLQKRFDTRICCHPLPLAGEGRGEGSFLGEPLILAFSP